jgi:hypothetical protein
MPDDLISRKEVLEAVEGLRCTTGWQTPNRLLTRAVEAIRALPPQGGDVEELHEGYTHCAVHNVDYPAEDGCAACAARSTLEEPK